MSVPTGAIMPYAPIGKAGQTVPSGYLLCDGTAVSRTTYAALFAILSTTFGVGDGSTTFNVPDLGGRSPIGAGTGSGLTARTLGATGGAATHTIILAEIPSHTHSTSVNWSSTSNQDQESGGPSGNFVREGDRSRSAGGGGSHNNMPPYLGVDYIVKT